MSDDARVSCLFESQQPFIMFNELNTTVWLDTAPNEYMGWGQFNAAYSELLQG